MTLFFMAGSFFRCFTWNLQQALIKNTTQHIVNSSTLGFFDQLCVVMQNMKKQLLMGILAGVASLAHANLEQVQQQLKAHYPNVKIENLQKTPMSGIYSGTLDNQIVYLGEDAEHLFVGSMIRLKDQRNLTKDLVVQQNSFRWSDLPLQDAIKTVKGNGKRQIAVFSDPHCPYCKQLERELDRLNNVTIYTFLYPLKSESLIPAQQIWCSPNRSYAWKNLINQNIQPQASSECANPIQRNLALGQRLKIQGTPTLFFSQGLKVTGVQTSTQIEQILKDAP